MPELFEIYDARDTTRTSGPYEGKEAAQAAADKLNTYIYENGLGKVLGLAKAQVIGPYYPRPYVEKMATRRVAVFDAGRDPNLVDPEVFE